MVCYSKDVAVCASAIATYGEGAVRALLDAGLDAESVMLLLTSADDHAIRAFGAAAAATGDAKAETVADNALRSPSILGPRQSSSRVEVAAWILGGQ